MPLRLLRLFLIFSAFGWGVCIVDVFASWPQVNSIAQGVAPKPFGTIRQPFSSIPQLFLITPPSFWRTP